jgi:hypothetical protein
MKVNYTLYKNAGFWLVNSRDIVLQIQALHCEFAECLLHVGVFASDLLEPDIYVYMYSLL